MAIRILLVDDHEIMREGLSSLLKGNANMEVIGEAANGKEAVRLAHKLKPDVIVMDVKMSEMDGIEATQQIIEELGGIKIIALSMYQKRSFIEGMLKAGASAYVLKDVAFSELEKAIKAVMADEIYLCSRTTDFIVNRYVRGHPGANEIPDTILTDREREILGVLADGKNTKQIALAFGISAKTVDTHRQHIMRKLDMQSLAELTKYAIREGLTSLE